MLHELLRNIDVRHCVYEHLNVGARIQLARALLGPRFAVPCTEHAYQGPIDELQICWCTAVPPALRAFTTPQGAARLVCAVSTRTVAVDALFTLEEVLLTRAGQRLLARARALHVHIGSMHTFNVARVNLGVTEAGAACTVHVPRLMQIEREALCSATTLSMSRLHNLCELNVNCNAIRTSGAAHIAALTELRVLRASYNQFGDAGVACLAAALQKLHTLHVSGNQLGSDGLRQVCTLPRLAVLHVSDNHFGLEGGARHLRARADTLTELVLHNNQLGPDAAAHVGALRRLHTLGISHNWIGDEGAAHLSNLQSLTELQVNHNRLGTDAAAHVAKLRRLRTLGILYNHIGDAGAAHLAALPELTVLHARHNDMSEVGEAICHKMRRYE